MGRKHDLLRLAWTGGMFVQQWRVEEVGCVHIEYTFVQLSSHQCVLTARDLQGPPCAGRQGPAKTSWDSEASLM